MRVTIGAGKAFIFFQANYLKMRENSGLYMAICIALVAYILPVAETRRCVDGEDNAIVLDNIDTGIHTYIGPSLSRPIRN
jgi:hypothetical protein